MDGEKWYVVVEGEQLGPMSKAELVELFKRGEARRTDLVWREGFETWRPAGKVEELQGLLPEGPPPPPRPVSELLFMIMNFFRQIGRIVGDPDGSLPRAVASKPFNSIIALIVIDAVLMGLYGGSRVMLRQREQAVWVEQTAPKLGVEPEQLRANLPSGRSIGVLAPRGGVRGAVSPGGFVGEFLRAFIQSLLAIFVFFCVLLLGFRILLRTENTATDAFCITGFLTIPMIPATAVGWLMSFVELSLGRYFLMLGGVVSALYLYVATSSVAKQEPRRALYFVPAVCVAGFVAYLILLRILPLAGWLTI